MISYCCICNTCKYFFLSHNSQTYYRKWFLKWFYSILSFIGLPPGNLSILIDICLKYELINGMSRKLWFFSIWEIRKQSAVPTMSTNIYETISQLSRKWYWLANYKNSEILQDIIEKEKEKLTFRMKTRCSVQFDAVAWCTVWVLVNDSFMFNLVPMSSILIYDSLKKLERFGLKFTFFPKRSSFCRHLLSLAVCGK